MNNVVNRALAAEKKLLTLLLAVAASVGTMFAEKVKIGDLYYNLDATNQTAEVTYKSYSNNYGYNEGWGITTANIPASVEYNSVTYSVTSIGEYAFLKCTSLTSVTIPNSVTSIGDGAFAGCSGLTSIIVENGNSFYDSRNNCNAIIETATNTLIAGCKNTIIPNSVTSISKYAFYECSGLTSVTIPNSVTSIGEYAFAYCYGLTSVTIPNSVTSIGDGAFGGCTGLKSVTIGNSVKEIGDCAFNACYGLTSVTIPNSVTSIGEWAFTGCSGLTSVTIPNSVTSIGEMAFEGCPSLTSINVASDNSNYCSVDGVLFNKDKTTLIQYPGGKQGAYTIPNSVTSISKYAFYACSGLTSVTIPNSVISIGEYAFAHCYGLTSMTIPNSVTSIGNSAFRECSGLTAIICKAVDLPTLGDYVFDYVPKNIPLYVPDGKESAYNDADQWKEFDIKPISAIPTGIDQTSQEPIANSQKLLINGQILILRGDKTYTIQGQEVR